MCVWYFLCVKFLSHVHNNIVVVVVLFVVVVFFILNALTIKIFTLFSPLSNCEAYKILFNMLVYWSSLNVLFLCRRVLVRLCFSPLFLLWLLYLNGCVQPVICVCGTKTLIVNLFEFTFRFRFTEGWIFMYGFPFW